MPDWHYREKSLSPRSSAGEEEKEIQNQRLRQLFQENTEDTCSGLSTESGGEQGPARALVRIDRQFFHLPDELTRQFGTTQLQDPVSAQRRVKVTDGKHMEDINSPYY